MQENRSPFESEEPNAQEPATYDRSDSQEPEPDEAPDFQQLGRIIPAHEIENLVNGPRPDDDAFSAITDGLADDPSFAGAAERLDENERVRAPEGLRDDISSLSAALRPKDEQEALAMQAHRVDKAARIAELSDELRLALMASDYSVDSISDEPTIGLLATDLQRMERNKKEGWNVTDDQVQRQRHRIEEIIAGSSQPEHAVWQVVRTRVNSLLPPEQDAQ